MIQHCRRFYPFYLFLLLATALSTYYIWRRDAVQTFSCQASFVQHHPNETLTLWLNYTLNAKSGMLSINGRIQSDPRKVINRKIAFQVQRKDHVYYLTSEKNIKFPDDNIDDVWLEKYEPLFFLYPGKSIYMRITAQSNNRYLFILGTLPTYVCHA
jgi:hypothetical protein